jgi:hypothetical protein
MTGPDFVLELEENALDSLKHAVIHFTEEDEDTFLKYVVLHTVHAVELFLKARLAKDHPLLIYDRPENAPRRSTDDYVTVGWDKLLQRLDRVGVRMSQPEQNALDTLRKARNRIEHHRVELSSDDVQMHLGQAMFFLNGFLRDELEIDLQEELSDHVYKSLKSALFTYEQRIELAERSINDELPSRPKEQKEYDRIPCIDCGNLTILVPFGTADNAELQCHFCDTSVFVRRCNRCENFQMEVTPFDLDEVEICDYCWSELMRGP